MIEVPNWVKVVVPAAFAVITSISAASWRMALSNEHRITAQEAASVYQAKALDANLARMLVLEGKFDNIILSLGRIEGGLQAERDARGLSPKPKK